MHTDVTAGMFTCRTQSSLLENPPTSASEQRSQGKTKKENPHEENLPQKTFIAQIPDLQLPWNMQWDELLEKQIV